MKSKHTITAVILAAGMSTRFGSPKQLLKVAGKGMLEQTITVAREAGFVSPVLVIGAFADDILQNVTAVKKCKTVVNRDFAAGQSSSLKAGVRSIMGTCEAALFLLADQPLIDAPLIMELLDRYNHRQPDILYPVYKTRPGNPVIINAHLFPRLLTATGDQGARFLFTDTSLHIDAYEVENKAVITDIDTWDDYLSLLQREKREK